MEQEIIRKDHFYQKLETYYLEKANKKPFSREKIESVISELVAAKQNRHSKNRREYFLLNTYDIVTIRDQAYLVKRHTDQEDNEIEYVVAYEDLFDKLYDVHVNKTGHGGRVKMESAINKKFCVPRPAIENFILCCKTCNEKKQGRKKLVIRPIISKDFNERGQVDLIDFQSNPDGEYKWILNYQDHSTKFLFLRPLTSKRSEEVASQLLSIFLLIGAPKILQSDNGREFVNHVIIELKSMWPECIIVHGRPRHPQSQGSVERANQDVEHMLRAWMVDNSSVHWSTGLNFVQWQKNISFHRTIGRAPYKALLGCDPKVGLASSNIPLNIAKDLREEEDLLEFLKSNEDVHGSGSQENLNFELRTDKDTLNEGKTDKESLNQGTTDKEDLYEASGSDRCICCICSGILEGDGIVCSQCSRLGHLLCFAPKEFGNNTLCDICSDIVHPPIVCSKVDQECQVEFYSESVVNSRTFICNRYVKDDLCCAETQTEIIEDARSVRSHIGVEKTVDKAYDTPEKTFVDEDSQVDNKHCTGFTSVTKNQKIIDLVGVSFSNYETIKCEDADGNISKAVKMEQPYSSIKEEIIEEEAIKVEVPR